MNLTLRVHDGGTGLAELMVPLANACNLAEGIDDRTSVNELRAWLGHPTPAFDPAADVVLAEVDGTLVGYAWVEWIDTTDRLREFRFGGYVHPDWVGRGIGRRLLDWQEEHARSHRAAAEARAAGTPVVMGTWAPDKRQRKVRLFQRAGYQPVRYFFTMRRTGLDRVEVPPMPEGIEIRPIGTDRASQRQLWDADVEAFQDHWGGFDASDQAFERELADPDHNPSLWVVAWDGDEIAGAVTNNVYPAENEALGTRRGWLDGVFVRRAWRRRGLAAAIVARSLVVLREAGMEEAMLGVDAENPSGALGLYERAGFVVHRRAAAYRKQMEVDA
jgi:GNAT superfamily N-acetyltransferase